MKIKVQIDISAGEERLKRMPPAVIDALEARENKLADALIAKAAGKAPKRSGRLAKSIKKSIRKSARAVRARVYVSGKARKYAGAIDRGAKIPPHEISPTKARALAFAVAGKQVVVGKVNHPGGLIRAHPFMRSTAKAMESEIRQELIDAVTQGLRA